jgi:hypothetical protein
VFPHSCGDQRISPDAAIRLPKHRVQHFTTCSQARFSERLSKNSRWRLDEIIIPKDSLFCERSNGRRPISPLVRNPDQVDHNVPS